MRKRGLIGSIRLFMCIYFPPPPLCSVSMLWSEGQSALCHLLEGGVRRCPLWDGRQHLGGAAQVEKAAEGGGDGSRDQDYSLSCMLLPRKDLFLSDAGHLGTCSIRWMYSVPDSAFCERGFCVNTHKPLCGNKAFFATLVCWYLISLLYLLCSVSRAYTETLYKGSDFIAWLQITLTRGKSDLHSN